MFDDELREMTRNAIHGLRLIAAGGQMPAPLQDSPKCPRCSLVGICLPDEVNYINRPDIEPRPLAVARDEALPMYEAGVRFMGETAKIRYPRRIAAASLKQLKQDPDYQRAVVIRGEYRGLIEASPSRRSSCARRRG